MHVHLQDDWDAKQEYTRTMATALLTWLPWHSQLPGCFFVEETVSLCEALLSRMVGRCRSQRHLTGFEATYNLFVTLPLPQGQPRSVRGTLKADLVAVFIRRLQAVISRPQQLLYAQMGVGNTGVWVAQMPPHVVLPYTMPSDSSHDNWVRLFQSVLAMLTGPYKSTQSMLPAIHSTVPLVSGQQSVLRAGFLDRTAVWRADRQSRLALERQPLRRPVRPPKPAPQPKRRAPASEPASGSQVRERANRRSQRPVNEEVSEESRSSGGPLYEPPSGSSSSSDTSSDTVSDGSYSQSSSANVQLLQSEGYSPSVACSDGSV